MPSFTYTGDEGRYYPTLGLSPAPGESYEMVCPHCQRPFDAAPDDERWVPAKPAKTTPAKEQ